MMESFKFSATQRIPAKSPSDSQRRAQPAPAGRGVHDATDPSNAARRCFRPVTPPLATNSCVVTAAGLCGCALFTALLTGRALTAFMKERTRPGTAALSATVSAMQVGPAVATSGPRRDPAPTTERERRRLDQTRTKGGDPVRQGARRLHCWTLLPPRTCSHEQERRAVAARQDGDGGKGAAPRRHGVSWQSGGGPPRRSIARRRAVSPQRSLGRERCACAAPARTTPMMPQARAKDDDRQGAGDPEGHRAAVALRALGE